MTQRHFEIPRDYPPFLYVPCTRHVSDPDDLEVEYRTTRDGRSALLVYSALDRLHDGMGEGQPWFVLPTTKLQTLYDVQPFDLVLVDVLVPEDARTHGASR
jgi:hypothetical protein